MKALDHALGDIPAPRETPVVISEVCLMFAESLRWADPELVAQFREALGLQISLPPRGPTRQEMYGGIFDFISEHKRPPTWSECEDLAANPEPHRRPMIPPSTLAKRCDSFAAGIDEAVSIYVDGRARPTRGRKIAEGERKPWTDPRCIDVMMQVRFNLGRWPLASETAALRRTSEKLLTAFGWKGLELPDNKVIKEAFGSHREWVDAARTEWDRRHAKAAARPKRQSARQGKSVRRGMGKPVRVDA